MFFRAQLSDATKATRSLSMRRANGYYNIFATDTLMAQLRIRANYPFTYCHQDAAGAIHLGYGQTANSLQDEFLHITFSPGGQVRIERDAICTLPLFYGYDGHALVLSNDFHDVCSQLRTLSVDYQHISYVFHRYLDMPTTPFKEISVLGECQELTYDMHGPPDVRVLQRPSDTTTVTDAHIFSRALQQSLDRFYDTRLASAPFAMEVSGGLDSSLLPLHLGVTRKLTGLLGYSFIMKDHQLERQRQKLHDIQTATGIRLMNIDYDGAQDSLPRLQTAKDNQYIHSSHGVYGDTYTAPLAALQQQGVRTVVTGLGGDQLFEHIPDRKAFDFNDVAHDLRAAFAGNRIISPDLNTPTAFLSSNTVTEYLTRTNTYLAYDIWPVSPFNDASLAVYVRALPVQFRDNKNILRAYYQAAQFPASLYHGQKEDFHTYFTNIMCSNSAAQRISTYSTNALTEQLGIASSSTLRSMYAQLRNAGPDPNGQLFLIYQWLNTECNIRLAKQRQQLIL